MEVQFKIGVPEGGTWDPTNDPSYQAAAGPNRERAALRRRRAGLGRRARRAHPGHHRADGARHADRVGGHRDRRDPELGGVDRQRRQRLAGYDVYREAGATDVLVGSPTAATFAVTGLTAVHLLRVLRGGQGRRGQPLGRVRTGHRHHADPPAPDTVAPTTPGTPTASAVTTTG